MKMVVVTNPHLDWDPQMEFVRDVQLLKRESVRLDTFHCWSIGCPIRREELSRQGFYYAGENDTVTCFFCKGQLNKWIAGDVVSIEHSKWYPNCPFVQGKDCGNVPMLDTDVKYPPYIMFYDRMESFHSWYTTKNLTSDRMASAGFFQINWDPQMEFVRDVQLLKRESVRLDTFHCWSIGCPIRREELSRQGFYYAGENDTVTCFFCKGQLNKWIAGDVVSIEHSKWYPNCPFVQGKDCGNVPMLDTDVKYPPYIMFYDRMESFHSWYTTKNLTSDRMASAGFFQINWDPQMEFVRDVQLLKRESVRLDTFHCWSIGCPIRREELSRQGFYYAGENDTVTCFFCKGQLNKWIAGDVVSIEHSKWYPNCPFVQGKDCGNVPMLDTDVKYPPYIMFYDRMESFHSWYTTKNLTSDRMASAGFFQINWDPQMEFVRDVQLLKRESVRLDTFHCWSIGCPIRREELSRQGFYYAGENDTVTCFFCKGQLNKWIAGDVVSIEHSKWYPNCPFVQGKDCGNVPMLDTDVKYPPYIMFYDRMESFHSWYTTKNLTSDRMASAGFFQINWDPQMEFVRDVQLLKRESVRLDTFHCWSIGCPIRREELSRQGFYYAGENDTVTCFFCKGQLNKWIAGDVVSIEHSKWYPNCPFVQGKDCGNVPMLDTDVKYPPYIMFYDRMESFHSWYTTKNLTSDRMASAGFFQINWDPQMEFVRDVQLLKRESVRLDTFHCWSIGCPIRREELSRQGFYYAGENDTVTCFFCKGQLNKWIAGDVVSIEHSKWCPFVQGKDCGNVPMLDTDVKYPPYIMFYDRMESFHSWYTTKNLTSDRMASAGFFQINWDPQMEFVRDVQLLKRESVRLDTFHCWSIGCPIRREELSRQGFYYAGENDTVTCFFCKGQLNKWIAGDVVSIEHSKWCPFVQGKDCGNVPMLDTDVKYPPYIMFYDRMESFHSWYTTKNLTSDRMASAGFFQITPFDHVKCFSCGVRLNKWLPDNDPWEEHHKFSPECPFVRERYGCYLGPDVMEQLTEFESLRINPGESPLSVPQQETGYGVLPEPNNLVNPERNNDYDLSYAYAAIASQSAPNVSSSQPQTRTSKEFLENLDELGPEELKQIILEQEDERLCKICFERKQKVIFQPCNHMVCCEQQRLCPICRRRIDKVNLIFFS